VNDLRYGLRLLGLSSRVLTSIVHGISPFDPITTLRLE